jgi:PAS domain S-box-containing protein
MPSFSSQSTNEQPQARYHRFAQIPGEMAEWVRHTDWANTPLGAIETWSETLLTSVATLLSAQIPMQLFWGSEMVTIYNDAMRPTLAEKHPRAIGLSGREVWKEVWADVGAQLESVLSEGKSLQFNAVPLRLLRNGVLEEMFWNYSYSPVLAPDGTVAGILNVSLEVTAIVLSRKALEASEKAASETALQLSRVLGATTDSIVVVDRDWTITYLNPAAEKLYGATAEIAGRNVWERFPEAVYEGSPFVRYYNQAMHEGKAGRFESYYPRPLDAWIQLEVYPTPDGIVTFSRDVTERRRIGEALAISERDAVRSKDELKVIIDALPSYLSYLDTDYRYVWVNLTYELWFKRSADEMIGRTIFEVLGADAAETVRSQMALAFSGERRNFEYKIMIFGEERILSVTHIPDFDELGRVRGVIVQGLDITDRKRSETALLQSEKLAAVGRLAASIAHEINNPLESVTNLLYLAKLSSNVEEIQEYLDTAERELRRVSVISNQTLRFYRQSTKPRPVTIDELLVSVLSIYHGRLVNSSVTLQQDRKTDQAIECFDGEIRQVLANLVGNAIDAMHPGGGRLILRNRPATDWTSGRKGVRVTVADTGLGMTASAQERVFEAFFTTKGNGGTGLGLWVSKEILDRHHARISLRSSQDPRHHGTVFSVFLPLVADAA